MHLGHIDAMYITDEVLYQDFELNSSLQGAPPCLGKSCQTPPWLKGSQVGFSDDSLTLWVFVGFVLNTSPELSSKQPGTQVSRTPNRSQPGASCLAYLGFFKSPPLLPQQSCKWCQAGGCGVRAWSLTCTAPGSWPRETGRNCHL